MRIDITVHCNACGHDQTTLAINPVTDGETLLSYLVGSAGFFCNECDSSNVAHTGATYTKGAS